MPEDDVPASGGGTQEEEGDHQAGAPTTSVGGLEEGEVPEVEMRPRGDARDAQARPGTTPPSSVPMEVQAPPRGVPPLRQPLPRSNVLRTIAHIDWLARVMGLSARQAQAPPGEPPSIEGDAGFIFVPATSEEEEAIAQPDAQMAQEPARQGEPGPQLQVEGGRTQQREDPQAAPPAVVQSTSPAVAQSSSPAVAQRSSSELSQELSQERITRRQLEAQLQ